MTRPISVEVVIWRLFRSVIIGASPWPKMAVMK